MGALPRRRDGESLGTTVIDQVVGSQTGTQPLTPAIAVGALSAANWNQGNGASGTVGIRPGASGTAIATFTTATDIPADGKITIDLPNGYVLSTTTASTITDDTVAAGSFSAAVLGDSNTSVTFTRAPAPRSEADEPLPTSP